MVFLGTPPTLGFFYKLTIFQCLSMSNGGLICAAVLINLALMVLYLQLVRTNQIHHKSRRYAGATTDLSLLALLTASVCAFVGMPHIIIGVCDLLISFQ